MASNNNQRDRSTGTATSRLTQARAAQRQRTKARLALSGPSGAGKTWTALCIAAILAPDGPVILVDTEPGDGSQGAAELYADDFTFDTIQWEPPYDPRDLALTLDELGRATAANGRWPDADGYAVIIIDSASHFWRGEGGTLDIADGRYGGWKSATPVQDHLVNRILRSPAHVIVCTRAKQAYALSVDTNGKQNVTKLGLEPIQRADLEYEFQVVAMIDTDHRIDIGKTRCRDLAGESFRANDQDRFARIYDRWLEGGFNTMRQRDVDTLVMSFDVVTDDEDRAQKKRDFAKVFGSPRFLDAEAGPDVWAWMTANLRVAPHAFAAGAEDPTRCSVCRSPLDALWHRGAADPPAAPDVAEAPPDAVAAHQGPPGDDPVTEAAAFIEANGGELPPQRPVEDVNLPEPDAEPDLDDQVEEAIEAAMTAEDQPVTAEAHASIDEVVEHEPRAAEQAAAPMTQATREQVEAHVAAMSIRDVTAELSAQGLAHSGTAVKLRKRLVDFLAEGTF